MEVSTIKTHINVKKSAIYTKKMSLFRIGIFSQEELIKYSIITHLYSKFKSNHKSLSNNYLQRMFSNKNFCSICFKPIFECFGHTGILKLEIPFLHCLFYKKVIKIIETICLNCNSPHNLKKSSSLLYKFLKNHSSSSYVKKIAFTFLILNLIENEYCDNCSMFIKKIKYFNDSCRFLYFYQNKLVSNQRNKAAFFLSNEEFTTYNIFLISQKVKKSYYKSLQISSSLENLFFLNLPIIPNILRLDFITENKKDLRNPLNTLYLTLIKWNRSLYLLIVQNKFSLNLMDLHVSQLNKVIQKIIIDTSITSNNYLQNSIPRFRGIMTRMRGKKGRIRKNILGKRVDFIFRSVISPNINLPIGFCSLPYNSRIILTITEKLINLNRSIHSLKSNVMLDFLCNVSFILKKNDKRKINFKKIKKNLTSKYIIKNGDFVERKINHLDFSLLNRQPSLHKFSILGHLLHFGFSKSLNINPSVCFPYNADFDGDEMNLHLCQNYYAKAEILELMLPIENLSSSNDSRLIINSIQDLNYYNYLKESKTYHKITNTPILKAENLKKKKSFNSVPFKYFTKVFSNNLYINYSLESMNFLKSNYFKKTTLNMAYGSYYYNSIDYSTDGKIQTNVPSSRVGKSELLNLIKGKTAILDLLCKQNQNLFTFSNSALTLSIKDLLKFHKTLNKACNPIAKFNQTITNTYSFQQEIINYHYKKNLDKNTLENSKRKLITNMLTSLTKTLKYFGSLLNIFEMFDNNFNIMIQSKTKGKINNFIKMLELIGQQKIFLNSLFSPFKNSLFNKNLYNIPSFNNNEVYFDSLFTGLSMLSFVSNLFTGRESLVVSAIRTSDTGYLSRKLQLSLTDISIFNDFSIRNSEGCVLILRYVSDCIRYCSEKKNSISVHRILDGYQKIKQLKLITNSVHTKNKFYDQIIDNNGIINILNIYRNKKIRNCQLHDVSRLLSQSVIQALQEGFNIEVFY